MIVFGMLAVSAIVGDHELSAFANTGNNESASELPKYPKVKTLTPRRQARPAKPLQFGVKRGRESEGGILPPRAWSRLLVDDKARNRTISFQNAPDFEELLGHLNLNVKERTF